MVDSTFLFASSPFSGMQWNPVESAVPGLRAVAPVFEPVRPEAVINSWGFGDAVNPQAGCGAELRIFF